jgi:ferrous iron transport protein B
MAHGRPMVVGLNMLDVAERRGLRLNITALARSLGVPVVPMVASKATGLEELRAALDSVLSGSMVQARPADLPPADAPPDALTAWADALTAAVGGSAGVVANPDRFSDRLDRFLTHPVYGTIVFLLVMGSLFWTLFEFATLPMAIIQWTFAQLGEVARAVVPAGPLQALVTDGIIGGIAGTVVFLPQIALLFFLISLL